MSAFIEEEVDSAAPSIIQQYAEIILLYPMLADSKNIDTGDGKYKK